LHRAGDGDQAALVGPAEVAVDLHAKGDGTEMVIPHGCGAAHGRVHPAGGLALLASDLGGVDRLPPSSQIQRGGEQADRDGKGSCGHRNAPGIGRCSSGAPYCRAHSTYPEK
jgi:hypothetical protein